MRRESSGTENRPLVCTNGNVSQLGTHYDNGHIQRGRNCALFVVIPLSTMILTGRASQGPTSAYTGRLVAIASAIVQP